MASFRFRLQTLLKLRRNERDERREDLAKALKAEEIVDEQRKQLQDETARSEATVRNTSLPGEVNVDSVMHAMRHRMYLQAQQGHLHKTIEQVRAEVARRRAALVEADRQVKMLEKLREQQAANHRRAEDRKEQILLDELGQRRRTNGGNRNA